MEDEIKNEELTDKELSSHIERKAYWIHPDRWLFVVETTHIARVIESPGSFGLTERKIKACYRKHGEELGTEGNARDELIRDIISRGWIRIRFYPRTWSWTINVNRLDHETSARLSRWATDCFGEGSLDPRDDIKIDMPDRQVKGRMVDIITEWMGPGMVDPRQP